ncbi:MAG TPA: integrase arm-type DNA-binding domain-containing protein [Ferrovibrio sp.]|uniref:tyrosine-type recombinase/integrase n=1 Tax=Ferrovibrio sp. TaxID=1917215 RepID=UPI002ED55240
MALGINRLKALAVSRLKEPGMHADGGGLYLQITEGGGRSWIFRYRMGGRKTPRDMGLGSEATLTLAEAREKARECRKLILDGIDPIEHRREQRAKQGRARAAQTPFKEIAEAYIAAQEPSWKSPKQAKIWRATLTAYAYAHLGSLPASAIGTDEVLKVLEPIWYKKPETGKRVRGRVEAILDYAKVRGLRTGENPARWKGTLDKLLPPWSRIRPVKHHPALPYGELPAFMAELREREGVAAYALQFTILTVLRTSEIRWAVPGEFNSSRTIWTIPKERMKGSNRDHKVPLSDPAQAIVKKTLKLGGRYVFPGPEDKKALSENAMLAVLDRMGRGDITVHGFRSAFRDWASEETDYPREVVEMCMAHAISDKVEAAYRRGDLFKKRAELMDEWAAFCWGVRCEQEAF